MTNKQGGELSPSRDSQEGKNQSRQEVKMVAKGTGPWQGTRELSVGWGLRAFYSPSSLWDRGDHPCLGFPET